MITRFDHLLLAMPAGGEAKARAFFGGVLGMHEEAKPDHLAGRGGCWFRSGSVFLHLGVEPDFRPQRKAHPAFCVGDLDAVAGRLEKAGFAVNWEESRPELRRFHCPDPFGNRIEFLQDEDGVGRSYSGDLPLTTPGA